jgi:hypothetical protein
MRGCPRRPVHVMRHLCADAKIAVMRLHTYRHIGRVQGKRANLNGVNLNLLIVSQCNAESRFGMFTNILFGGFKYLRS